MTNITLHNNVLAVHNGAALSAVGLSRPVYTAKLSNTLSTTSNRVSTVEDISSWQIGDFVVFIGPTTNLTSAPRKTIASIVDSHTFTINSGIDTNRTLDTVPEYTDHIFNLTRELQIAGFSSSIRGAIRILDSGKVNIVDAEFSNWGILGDTTCNGIVFAANNDNTSTIESCSLIGDFVSTTNFISHYPSFRTQGPSLYISNNIIHNVDGSAIKIDAPTVTPMSISAVNNKFIVSNVRVNGISSTNSFILSGNQFISSYYPATIVDFRWISSPIVQNEGYYGNRSYALSAANLIDMKLDSLTATFNDKTNQQVIGPLYLTNCSNITAQNITSNDNYYYGIHFNKVYHSSFLLDSTFNRNIYSNVLINAPNSLSLSAFNITNVNVSNATNHDGINYTGSLNLVVDSVTSCNNRYGLNMQYDGNATIISEDSPSDIVFTGPTSTSSTLIEDSTTFVVVPHNTKFAHGNNDFTYEAYINLPSTTGQHFVFDLRDSTISPNDMFLYVNNGIFTGGNNGTYWPQFGSTSTIQPNTWYHVALCRFNRSVKLFVNGVQIGGAVVDNFSNKSVQLTIGSQYSNAAYLNGYISQVRVNQTARYPTNPVPDRVNDNYTFTTNVILSTVNSALTSSSISNIYMNNVNSTILLTPNIIHLSNNNLRSTTHGIQANNIAGNIDRNIFASCTLDAINISVGNRHTLVSNNTAYLITNRIVTTITDGLNYFPTIFNNNQVYSEGEFDLQPGGVGLYNRAAPAILTSWPACAIIANPSQGTLPRNSVAGLSFYTRDLDIEYLKIVFTGGANPAWTVELYVDNVIKGSLNSTGTPTTVIFNVPKTNAAAQFKKITIKIAKTTAAEHGDISMCVQDMKYSYDGINFMSFDFAYLYYNASIKYSNSDPINLTTVFGAAPSFTFANINDSNFKKLHVINTLNASIVPLYVRCVSGPVLGSYIIEHQAVSVDTASVKTYYQDNTEKSVGFAWTDLPNISTINKKGSINFESSVVINTQSNAPSELLRPTASTKYNKLKSAKKYIPASANNAVKVYTFAKVSSDYNGTPPRLIVSQHAALGVETDRVLQEYTSLPNTWQLLEGTVDAPNKDGVLEFYVECDGTAGYVAVDSWAAPI